MNNPLVSIYIPTRNRLSLLKRAIDSVFAQTYKRIELIVADDGSTDGTRDYLSTLHNSGALRAVLLPAPMGACVARNFAICESRGAFVTGLDDDDVFLPDRIERFVLKWKHLESADACAPVAGLFDDLILLKSGCRKLRHSFPPIVNYADLLEKNDIGNQIFSSRDAFLAAGLFDPSMPAWQDWDLWRRMSKRNGCFVNLGIGTYLADESHSHLRTTSKPEFMIRYAMEMLNHKSGTSSLRVRASLLIACLCYSQVRLTWKDVFLLVSAGRWTSLVKFIVKLLRLRQRNPPRS